MWELLIHSTKTSDLPDIIKDGYLKPIPYKTTRPYVPGVYMHLLFNTLEYKGIYWHHKRYGYKTNSSIFIFDISILKKNPFILCPYSSHGDCKDHYSIKTDGNLNRKPNLSKIKNIINSTIKSNDDPYIFNESHEFILLNLYHYHYANIY